MHRREQGFTLIEMVMVLAVVGLMIGLGARGFRSLAKSDLRASSSHLSGAIRYLFDRASTTGKIHRLVLDLNEGKYWAEVSDDRFYVPHEAESEEDLRRREEKEAEDDEEKRIKEEKRLKELENSSSSLSASSSYDPSKLEVGDFKPRRARFSAFKEVALKPVTFKNAKVRSVYTPRVTEAITSGRAYIYFFPLGQTEPAIITLTDVREQSFYSVVVHPITGRVRIYNEEIRPPISRDQIDDEGKQVVQ